MVSNSEPVAEGTVIMADDQFAGRGQQGNTWVSKAGLNLTFSIYLRPTFLPLHRQFDLNIAVSIGVNQALAHYVDHDVTIKWPNDIYYKDQKIGGILIENTVAGTLLKGSIIGIGLNVNQVEFDRAIHRRASSLKEILHQHVDLNVLLGKICHGVETQYLKLRSGREQEMRNEYLKNLYRFNQLAKYRATSEVFDGQITGLSDEGRLIVQAAEQVHSYGFKEIEFLD